MRLFDNPSADSSYDRWLTNAPEPRHEVNYEHDVSGRGYRCTYTAACGNDGEWEVEIKKIGQYQVWFGVVCSECRKTLFEEHGVQ